MSFTDKNDSQLQHSTKEQIITTVTTDFSNQDQPEM
jgi:hypothetical protein